MPLLGGSGKQALRHAQAEQLAQIGDRFAIGPARFLRGIALCQPSSFSTTQRALSCNTLCSHFSEARNGTLTVRPRSSMRRPMLRRLPLRFSV